MRISLQDAGKRFNREWIFRHVHLDFEPGKTYAITGPNGSGKSTLLQVIAGAVQHSEGSITYTLRSDSTPLHQPYPFISIAAPYLELVEEMTATEFLKMHFIFKTPVLTVDEMLKICSLEHAAHKQIRYFSSGMKQRLRLAQAFFSKGRVLFLDEPATNLDEEGIALYKTLLNTYRNDRLTIISSNDAMEYTGCDQIIRVEDYK